MNRKPQHLLDATLILLACIYFFLAAGRFHGSIFGISFSTGYDAYKLVPFPFLTWLLWKRQTAQPFNLQSPFLLPMTALFLITLITGFASPDSWQALADSLEILFYLGLFLLLIDLPWTPKVIHVLSGGFIIGNLYLGSVLYQQYASAHELDSLIRFSGTFNHPNMLGAYALLGFTISLLFLHKIKSRILYGWMICTALILFMSLLLCQSRTALLALGVWMLSVMWRGSSNLRKIAGAALLCTVLLLAQFMPHILHRFLSLPSEIPQTNQINRSLIWHGILQSEIPSLSPFGVGMGPTTLIRFDNWLASQPDAPALTRAWGPHNTYLAWWVGNGLLGLFFFVWLWKVGWDRIQDCDAYNRALLTAGFCSFLVACFFQDPFLTGNIPIAWITMLAIVEKTASPPKRMGMEEEQGA